MLRILCSPMQSHMAARCCFSFFFSSQVGGHDNGTVKVGTVIHASQG